MSYLGLAELYGNPVWFTVKEKMKIDKFYEKMFGVFKKKDDEKNKGGKIR